MKILVAISHPAHVHFFKHFMWEMKEKGQQILTAASEKEVSLKLLDAYEFKYEKVGNYRGSLVMKSLGMLKVDWNMYKVTRKFKPDIILSLGSPNAAHVSALLGKPHITFDDTEHSTEQYYLYAPFTSIICTPSCFKKNLGKKQVRYNGYHELAYLHPNYFKPDPSILKEAGIGDDERFIIVRFVSWQASHDIGQRGFNMQAKNKLVSELEKYGRVFITSESPLPDELVKYRLTVSPERLHDLLYYATLCIGEGATVASECAVMGTPVIYMNTLRLGYLDEQEERYGLVYNYSNPDTAQMQALDKAIELLQRRDLKEEWQVKRQRMLNDKIDVTDFMVKLVEGYPQSMRRGNG